MAQNKNPQIHYLVTESYLMTRGAALHFPYRQFAELAPTDQSVYGFVVDMPVNPQTIITLVVYVNGAANLYFNNGGSYTGASQRYPSVVQISRALMANAARILGEAKKTKQFDLPTGREHHIFLLTKRGIYRKSFLPMDLRSESTDLRSIYALYQQVMRELQTAQLKDRVKGNSK